LAEAKSFFSSGLFYILIGCAFLYAGYSVSLGNRAHSAFVFLLAIVGVALVLYGTGTNAEKVVLATSRYLSPEEPVCSPWF
jgi:hypothetical protein